MNDTQPEFLLFHRFCLKREAIVAAALLLLLILLRGRVFFNLSNGFLGGYEYDAGLYVWLVKSNLRDLFSEAWFNTKAFYPYGNTLAWSDNFILPSFIAGLLQLIGFSLASSYNLVLLGAMFLNSYLTYLCCFYLRGMREVALVPAVFMLCYSFLAAHLGHPQLQFVFFFPLLTVFFFRFVKAPTWPRALLLTLPVTLAFLCSVYIAIFLVLALAALTAGTIIARPTIVSKDIALKFFSGSLATLLPLIPFVLPYLAVQDSFGQRGLYEPNAFAASISAFFSAPKLSLLYSWLSSLGSPETHVFPGFAILGVAVFSFLRLTDAPSFKKKRNYILYVFAAIVILSIGSSFHWIINYPLSLALWALPVVFAMFIHYLGESEVNAGAKYFTNRSFIAVFIFAAAIFFVFAFGPLISGDQSVGPLAPFTFFYYTVPGVSAIRAIGRFAIPLFFFLALAINFGLPHIMRKHKHGRRLPYLLIALILLENYQLAYPFEGITQRPTAFTKLDQTEDKNTAVIALPFTEELNPDSTVKHWSDFSKKNVNYMHWNFGSDTYLVNGYSGMRSWLMMNFPRKMTDFPDERSMAALSQIPNLSKIILLPSFIDEKQLNENIVDYPQLQNMQSFGDSILLDFQPLNELKTKTSFLLRVPSKTEGHLFLTLRTEEKATNPMNVRVFIDKYFEHDPYTELSVPQDTEWHELGIKMPTTSESVIPYIVRFETQEGSKVFLGKREFRPS